MKDKMKTLFKGCLNKKSYLTELDAKQSAKGVSKKFGQKMLYYKCDHCVEWHLTTDKQKPASSGSKKVVKSLNQTIGKDKRKLIRELLGEE